MQNRFKNKTLEIKEMLLVATWVGRIAERCGMLM